MNLKKILRPLSIHLLIILGFVILSYAYFGPVITGKTLTQMDNTHTLGMSHELAEYQKTHPGVFPMWTNSMFGGMPSYLITGTPSFDIYHSLQIFIRLFLPYTTVAIMFLLLVGFYFLLISLRVNKLLSVGGAIGFAFASFNIIIISVGHITQAYAISFMPMVIAGILMLFDRKYISGGLLSLFSIGIEISFSHPQITYYCFLIILILFIVQFIYGIIEKDLKHFFIVGGITLLALILGLLPNITNLWTTYEYGKYSIRGKSELKEKGIEAKSSGLDKDYAYQWSYGIRETYTILIPNFQGGGASGFDGKSKTSEALENLGSQNAKQIASSIPAYWGSQPFTSGPVYFGAIICFLFVLGLFVIKGPLKWWLLVASLLSIILSWGKNFSILSDLFFYHFPGYNKFRTVTMILVIANFTFPLLGFLALKRIFEGNYKKNEALKALKYSLYIVGGLLLIFILIPGWFFDFSSSQDSSVITWFKSNKLPEDTINSIVSAMQSDRESMLRLDAFRSLVFVLLSAGLLWAFIAQKIKPVLFSAGLGLLILVDLWTVDRRYLNNDNFVTNSEYKNQFVESLADAFILKDTDPDYRVLNLTRNPFNDAYTPYFHKSIGGYHGAKMRRYQDLIDGPLSQNMMFFQSVLQSRPDPVKLNETLNSLSILNMLNTKYIIYNEQANPIFNTAALGSVWLVNEIKWVGSADEELAAVNNFNPGKTAIVDKRFEGVIPNIGAQNDTTDKIKLIKYSPAHLTYQSNCLKPRLAVFSEIYYDKGWNAYVDGKKQQYGRADYVLRTMIVPEGEHKLEFKFEPQSYMVGKNVAMASSVIVILILLAGLGWGAYSLKEQA